MAIIYLPVGRAGTSFGLFVGVKNFLVLFALGIKFFGRRQKIGNNLNVANRFVGILNFFVHHVITLPSANKKCQCKK